MDRKRRMMSAQSTSVTQQLMDGAPFVAQLTKTLALQRGTGSATFTRDTTKTFTDHEGVLRTAPAGCAAFTGARFGWNLDPTNSEDNTAGAWGSNVNSSSTAAVVTLTTIDGSFYYKLTSANIPAGNTVIFSVTLTAGTKSVVTLRAAEVNNGLGAGINQATISATPARYSVVATNGDTVARQFIFGFDNRVAIGDTDNSAGTFTAEEWQLEDITGRADQTTPSEYVSVGVESAPYHGAGVDGVKYFDTDISGNPLTTLKGYLAEGARTNLALQSESLDSASWSTVSGVTVTANQYVAPTGATTMDRINVTAGNSTHYIGVGGITYTASPYTLTMYLRYTNNRWAVIDINDAATNHCASFDLLNGVVGAVSAGVTSKIQATNDPSVFRCHLTVTPAATGSGVVIVGANNSDSATLQTWNAAGTETIGAWGAQVELGSFASSYIATTTVAVTRNADVLTYPSAGNASTSALWLYAELKPAYQPADLIAVTVDDGSNNNRVTITESVSGGRFSPFIASGGAVQYAPLSAGSMSTSSSNKVAVTMSALGADAATNAELLTTTGAITPPASFTTIRISGRATGDFFWFGNIKNVRIGQRQLSASELQAITS